MWIHDLKAPLQEGGGVADPPPDPPMISHVMQNDHTLVVV